MNAGRVIYHLARADFLERVRRYSFLVMLGLVVLLGYQTAIGKCGCSLSNAAASSTRVDRGHDVDHCHVLPWLVRVLSRQRFGGTRP
jgi:hypothetical protein